MYSIVKTIIMSPNLLILIISTCPLNSHVHIIPIQSDISNRTKLYKVTSFRWVSLRINMDFLPGWCRRYAPICSYVPPSWRVLFCEKNRPPKRTYSVLYSTPFLPRSIQAGLTERSSCLAGNFALKLFIAARSFQHDFLDSPVRRGAQFCWHTRAVSAGFRGLGNEPLCLSFYIKFNSLARMSSRSRQTPIVVLISDMKLLYGCFVCQNAAEDLGTCV